jgi:hypothetical protein
MSENVRESVYNWVRTRIHGPTGTPPMKEFVLQAVGSNGVGTTVTTQGVPAGTTDPNEIVDELITQATYYAETLNDVTRFILLAYRGDSRQPFGSRPFVIDGKALRPDGDPMLSEPSGDPGGYAQALRHNESLFRMSAGMTGQTFAILRAENDRLRREVERMAVKAERVLELHEELSDRKAEREMAHLKAQNAERRRDIAIGVFAEQAPKLFAIISSVAAKKLAGVLGGGGGGAPPQLPPPGMQPPPSMHAPPQQQQAPAPPTAVDQAVASLPSAPSGGGAVTMPLHLVPRDVLIMSFIEGLDREVLPNDAQQVAAIDMFIEMLEASPEIAFKIAELLPDEMKQLLMSLYAARELRKKFHAPMSTSQAALAAAHHGAQQPPPPAAAPSPPPASSAVAVVPPAPPAPSADVELAQGGNSKDSAPKSRRPKRAASRKATKVDKARKKPRSKRSNA